MLNRYETENAFKGLDPERFVEAHGPPPEELLREILGQKWRRDRTRNVAKPAIGGASAARLA